MDSEQKQRIKEQVRKPIEWFKYNVKCCYNCTKWCKDVTLRGDYAHNFCKEHKDVMTVWDSYCNYYDGYAQEDNLFGALTDKEREEVWSEVQQEVQNGESKS